MHTQHGQKTNFIVTAVTVVALFSVLLSFLHINACSKLCSLKSCQPVPQPEVFQFFFLYKENFTSDPHKVVNPCHMRTNYNAKFSEIILDRQKNPLQKICRFAMNIDLNTFRFLV